MCARWLRELAVVDDFDRGGCWEDIDEKRKVEDPRKQF